VKHENRLQKLSVGRFHRNQTVHTHKRMYSQLTSFLVLYKHLRLDDDMYTKVRFHALEKETVCALEMQRDAHAHIQIL
jgi:hypothetical protein